MAEWNGNGRRGDKIEEKTGNESNQFMARTAACLAVSRWHRAGLNSRRNEPKTEQSNRHS